MDPEILRPLGDLSDAMHVLWSHDVVSQARLDGAIKKRDEAVRDLVKAYNRLIIDTVRGETR